MPIRSAVEQSGKLIKNAGTAAGEVAQRAYDSAAPQLQHEPTLPTARDYTTSGLGAASTVLLVAVLHHGVGVDLSPEVVAALTTVMGYMAARYFRY